MHIGYIRLSIKIKKINPVIFCNCDILLHFDCLIAFVANKIIMLNYSPVHPARVNPEFVGVATKCSSIKKNRASLEKDRDQLLRKLKYRISVDRHLEKNLQENRGKLRNVRSVHRRHQEQLEQKKERGERQKRQMIELNRTVQLTRQQQRQSIKEALSRTISRKRQSRNNCGQMQSIIQQELRSAQMSRLSEKRLRFKEIKLLERDSQHTVHQFYRERNTEHLHHYQSRIQEQKSKYLQFVDEIKQIESSIDHYDSRIDKKKEQLVHVLDQISVYTMETVQTQNRCLPLYLRDTMSTSTHSSKPSEILLRGPRSIIAKDI